MEQITIKNAHGHTVTISGDFRNLVSYLMHMSLLVSQANQRFVELKANIMAERTNQDLMLLHKAIEELRENH